MDEQKEVVPATGDHAWTRIEGYIGVLNRRRIAARRRSKVNLRTEPELPNFVISTLPFVALAIALAVIAGSVIVLAWPGGH